MSLAPDAPSAGPNPGAATLDPQALAALRELDPDGQAGLLAQVFKAFDASLERLPAKAASALEQGDVKGVGDVAHTLKSSAASVGATELHRCCVHLEREARAGALDALAPLVGALLVESRRVRAALAVLQAGPATAG